MGGNGSGGGKRSGGGGGGFTTQGSRIFINGDVINMQKRGAYQGRVGDQKTSLSKDRKISTTEETRLYKGNSGSLYEVTERTVVRERSKEESRRIFNKAPYKYKQIGWADSTSLDYLYDTTTTVTKVKKRKS